LNTKPFKADHPGFAYLLAGKERNTDPYANNSGWFESPHIMVLVPNPAQLKACRPIKTAVALRA
jgi:hypothetical protein